MGARRTVGFRRRTAGRYVIALTNPGTNMWVRAFRDEARTQLVVECGDDFLRKACFFDMSGGTGYVDLVHEGAFTRNCAFRILAVEAEGTGANPIALSVDGPRLTVLPLGGQSYSEFSTSEVGGHAIWISCANPMDTTPSTPSPPTGAR